MKNLAKVFATTAHAGVGQLRKYSGDPYIVHPIRVADLVASYGGSDDMIAAAYLHDVVEDTDVDIDTIRDVFGDDIASIVCGLTDVSKPGDGNRAVRKAIDRDHSAAASREAQFVKCADIIDNSSDIADNDPSFWKVYKSEMKLLLDILDKVKDTDIYRDAVSSVNK